MFYERLMLVLLLLLRQCSFCSSQNTILSEGKRAVQSSTLSTFSADLAVDGNTATDFGSGSCSYTLSEVGPYWYVDLGDLYSVDYVYIYKTEGSEALLIGTDVRVTSDESTVQTSTNLCGTTITLDMTTSDMINMDCNPSINGRYVSLYRSSNTDASFSVCEVQVIGVLLTEIPVVTCPDDIATTSKSTSTKVVTWNPPTITDNVDGLSATCTPYSGSSFPIGTTTVMCSATDSNTNTGSCSFTVQVIVDDQIPSLICPDKIFTSEAAVTWDAPVVTDNVDTDLSATCNPPSGSSFTAGSSSVFCYVYDTAGNIGTCSFIIDVTDVGVPSVACPGNIDETTDTGAATVTWSDPVVSDNVDTDLIATCTPSSGSPFTTGTTDVTCSTMDTSGNEDSCTFIVNIIDVGSPSVTCPGNIDETTGTGAATVTWSDPVVSDNVDTGLSATCTPSSGSSFTVGSTDVICSATDAAGNTGSCAFTVNVNDVRSPSVTCPNDIEMSTASSQTTVIWNDLIVSDNIDTGLSATCTPSSGSSFTVGSTEVTCSATDAAGNIGSCAFTINFGGSNDESSSVYLIAVVVILCVIILMMFPALIFFCRFYYSHKNKRMEPTTGINMTDYDNVAIATTTTNTPHEPEYEIQLPTIADDAAAVPPKLKTQERASSGYEDLHTYMEVDHAFTDLKK